MPVRYALTSIPYALNDVKLGSPVPSVKRPNQDTIVTMRRLREGADYTWRNEMGDLSSLGVGFDYCAAVAKRWLFFS
jgi:hypothetical protein